MGRPVIGIFYRAARRDAQLVGLHNLMHEIVEVSGEVYSPMCKALDRYRWIRDNTTRSASDADDQIEEQMVEIMRSLSFFSNRMRAIIRAVER